MKNTQKFKIPFMKLNSEYKPSSLAVTLLVAFLSTLILEILQRSSFASAFSFLFLSPHLFLLNFAIISFSLSFSLLFKKRRAFLILFSSVWIIFGITDFIMGFFRVTPFSCADFGLLKSVWQIIGVYFTLWQIVIFIILITALIAGIFFMFKRCRKEKPDFKLSALTTAISAFLMFFLIFLYSHTGILPRRFTNLPDAYRDYGFAFCFSTGLFDRGIDEPKGYSEESVDNILASIGVSTGAQTDKKPNIIFCQLESFFDVNRLKNVSFSENPTKNFSALKESCSGGFVSVPSIGSGTVNTEFEVLTGMSLDPFGTSEYPYNTILQNSTCESICFNLKEQGYSSHAIHNYTASFYDRNLVYQNLGFDTFTSIEYMNGISYNPVGWANDDVLLENIFKALSLTENQDLIYTITVQAHGRYPSDLQDEDDSIEVFGIEDEALKGSFTYYVNQLSQTDAFIGNLISRLSDFDEPTVLVLFGDHLPSLDIQDSMLSDGNVYQTDYVIWASYPLEQIKKDLQAYQLSACVMQRVSFTNGIFTKLHQTYSENPNYQSALEMLEYDVLYGDYNVYGGKQKYRATSLQMGLDKITISSCEILEGKIKVCGTTFNDSSVIELDGKRLDTDLDDDGNLLAKLHFGFDFEDSHYVKVLQASKNGIVFSETEPFEVSFPNQKQ